MSLAEVRAFWKWPAVQFSSRAGNRARKNKKNRKERKMPRVPHYQARDIHGTFLGQFIAHATHA